MNRHVRSSSANVDNKAFREAISRMRVEVLEAKAETQRVQDQLNCLIMLVKRCDEENFIFFQTKRREKSIEGP